MEHNIDIVCIQEQYHSEVEIKYHDAGNGSILLQHLHENLRQCRYRGYRNASQSSRPKIKDKIQREQRMLVAAFNGNPAQG